MIRKRNNNSSNDNSSRNIIMAAKWLHKLQFYTRKGKKGEKK